MRSTNVRKSSLRKKQKHILHNRHLQKAIVPKNAIRALSEIKGVSVGNVVIDNNPSGGFIATVIVNGRDYEGRGPSKAAAKNDACESAMRDHVLAKMYERPRQMLLNRSNRESIETMETEDVPMVSLASFAIHKLFLEWENEGYSIPKTYLTPDKKVSDEESTTDGGKVNESKKQFVRNALPQNWKDMHPTSLLVYMRPNSAFVDKGSTDVQQNRVVHTFAISVDGEDFEGCGPSKKTARRNVAAIACNAVFKTNFVVESPPEVSG